MKDIILVAVIILLVGLAGVYVYKAKKSGKKCVGCPYSEACGKHSCNCNDDK